MLSEDGGVMGTAHGEGAAPCPVAIVGAGAIGLTLAGALAAGGHPLTVCGGRPFAAITLTATDGTVARWPVAHTADPATVAATPLIVVAVKAPDTPAIGPWLRALAGPGSTVVVAQNGIEQRERVAPFVGDARIVPAVVYTNVERTGVGAATVRHPVSGPDLAVPDDPAGREVAARFNAGGLIAAPEADFRAALWTKLLINIVGNSLTALTGRRVEVVRDPAIAAVGRDLLAEAVAVARAEGVPFPADQPERTLAWLRVLPPGATSSMLQDRLAGRPLEYDALTGAVVRAAERHGLPVPINRTLLALLAALQ